MAEKTSNRITLTIEGSSIDEGHVRLSDFIDELEALKEALRQTERSIYNTQRAEVYYRIVDASHSSPLRMVFEPVTSEPALQSRRRARAVTKAFTGSIGQLHRQRRPANIDVVTLESYKDLGATLGRHVERILIGDDHSVSEFHTFDGADPDRKPRDKTKKHCGLLRLDGNVAGHVLKVCKPSAEQLNLLKNVESISIDSAINALDSSAPSNTKPDADRSKETSA